MIKEEIEQAINEYSNTTLVKVKWEKLNAIRPISIDSNTTLVKVKWECLWKYM